MHAFLRSLNSPFFIAPFTSFCMKVFSAQYHLFYNCFIPVYIMAYSPYNLPTAGYPGQEHISFRRTGIMILPLGPT